MMKIFNTKDVARMLGVSIAKLQRAIWDERVDPPAKGPGGAFVWQLEDIDRVSWQLLHRAYVPQGKGVPCAK